MTNSSLSNTSLGLVPTMLDDSSIWKSWYTAIIGIFAVIITVGFIGNLLVLYVFFKHCPMKTVTDWLICNLAFSDLLTMISTSLLTFYSFSRPGMDIAAHSKTACLTTLTSLNFGLFSSFIAIFTLSVQRLMAVLTPIRFRRQKKNDLLVFLLTPWTLVMACVSLPFFGWNDWLPGKRCSTPTTLSMSYTKIFIVGPFAFMLLAIPLLTAITFVVLVKQQRKFTKQADLQNMNIRTLEAENNVAACSATEFPIELAAQEKTKTSQTGKRNTTKTKESHNQVCARRHFEVSKGLLITVVSLYTCILPYLVCLVARWIEDDLFIRHPKMEIVFELTKPLLILHGALNPVINACKHRRFKEAFNKMIKVV